MQLWDGEQKMSDWPAEIKNAISENGIYRKDIAYSQSKLSKNEILVGRLIGKKYFISYNKQLNVFFVWHIENKIEQRAYKDKVILKIPRYILNEIDNKNHFTLEKYAVSIKNNENGTRLCDVDAIAESRFVQFFKENFR